MSVQRFPVNYRRTRTSNGDALAATCFPAEKRLTRKRLTLILCTIDGAPFHCLGCFHTGRRHRNRCKLEGLMYPGRKTTICSHQTKAPIRVRHCFVSLRFLQRYLGGETIFVFPIEKFQPLSTLPPLPTICANLCLSLDIHTHTYARACPVETEHDQLGDTN